MEYKKLGRTGLKVSAVALGCGNFGGIGSSPALRNKGEPEPMCFAILDAAWDMGITLFDTANSYGGGFSETVIGRWLKQKGPSVRSQLILASKVYNRVGDGPNDAGLSRHHILRQIDESLRRLGTDYLDLYLIHAPDPATPLDETLRALDDVVRAGKARYLGACNMPAWLMTKALWMSDKHLWSRFDWVQNSFSLLNRHDEHEMFPLCADQGLGYTPFSPLAGGWLTGKYREGQPYPPGSRMDILPGPYRAFTSPKIFRGLEGLRACAEARGTDMMTLALAWVMSHPVVTAPIVGPRSPEQLDPARRALAISLGEDERRTLAQLFTEGPCGTA
jgi:aryl-alcohol dehydrogenase-like predicted oxidoreductase